MSNPGSPVGPDGPDDHATGPVPPPPSAVPPPPLSTPGPVPSAPGPAGPLQYLDGPEQEPAIVPRKRRGLVAGVLAAVVVLVVPGAVFAWQALDGGGTQPHDVLPAEAVGYVRLDLDPSAGQKIEAFRFLNKFPLFEEATGITDENTDLRERLVDAFAGASGCDLDFQADVGPWIGNRLGAAMLPPADDGAEPGFVLTLQANDEDAALAAMDKVLGCGGSEAGIGSAYVDGYLLITDTQENADAYAASARVSSLADNAEFTQAMEYLGEQGIASMWFSGSAMLDAFGGSAGAFGIGAGASGGGMPTLEDTRELVDETYRSVAVSFRFDDRYAEIAAVATGSSYHSMDGGGVDADVPDDTTMFLGANDAGQYLIDSWDTAVGSVPDAEEQLDALEQETGLSIPEDLSTALGENLVVAMGAGELDLEALLQDGDVSSLDLGARVVTDPEAFADLWERVQGLAADAGTPLDDIPLQTTDDGYVIATNEDYAAALLDGGGLGDSEVYTTAVGDSSEADSVFFLNFDVIEDDVLAMAGDLTDAEVESIRALQALGLAAHIRDGHMEMSLRLTAN